MVAERSRSIAATYGIKTSSPLPKRQDSTMQKEIKSCLSGSYAVRLHTASRWHCGYENQAHSGYKNQLFYIKKQILPCQQELDA